jgi:hypothetical protein
MSHVWERKVFRVLIEKPEGKRLLGRPRRDGRMVLEWMLWRLTGGGVDPVGSG